MRILIVEDDPLLADGINRLLHASGHTAAHVESAEQAGNYLARESYDLMLLDLGLPGMDGLSFLRALRAAHQDIVILILTARDALNERVGALNAGADDYLSKPFASEELLARITALTRRRDKPLSQKRRHGPLLMELDSHRVWLDGQSLDLPMREWMVMRFLIENVERVVSKERIVRMLCDWDKDMSSNTVEIYISRLRGRFETHGIHIRTVRGVGYMLEEWHE